MRNSIAENAGHKMRDDPEDEHMKRLFFLHAVKSVCRCRQCSAGPNILLPVSDCGKETAASAVFAEVRGWREKRI